MNIVKYVKCNRQVIHEELEFHECISLKEYKIIDNTLWVSDGKYRYPLKLRSTDSLHQGKQLQNGQNRFQA